MSPMRSFVCSLLLIGLTASNASAQLFIWDGGGTDNFWGTAANWSTTSPTSGINTRIDFLGSLRPTPILNSYGYSPDPFQLNQLTLNTSTSFSLSGNDLDFRTNSSAATPLITVTTAATHSIVQNLILSDNLSITSVAGGNLGISGMMSGSGNLTISMGASSALTLSAANTYAGTTSINTGTITLNGSLSASASAVTISGGSVLNGTGTINRPVIAAGAANFGGTLTITNTLTVNSSSVDIQAGASTAVNGLTTVATGVNFNVRANATLSGSGNVAINPSGQISFYGGSAIGSGKTVTLTGNASFRAAIVGDGTVHGPVIMNGAQIWASGGGTIVLNSTVVMNAATVGNVIGNNNGETAELNGLLTVASGTGNELTATNLTGSGNIQVNTGAEVFITSTVANTKTMTLNGVMNPFSTGTYNGPINLANGELGGNTFTINGDLTVSGTSSIGRAGFTNVINTNGDITFTAGSTTTVPNATTWGGTGSLTVANGATLIINPAMTINKPSTLLQGSLIGEGNYNSLVTAPSGSRIAPGNSPGTITIAGGLDIGGTLEMDISSGGSNNSTSSGNTSPGSGFDTIIVSPSPSTPNTPTNAIVRQAAQIRVIALDANLATDFWSDPLGQKWLFVQATNGQIQFSTGDAGDPISVIPNPPIPNVTLIDSTTGNPINYQALYPTSSFSYERIADGSGENLNLVWSPVPEPATVFAVTFAIALAARPWRRGNRPLSNISVS
jgi:hypothetical protein